METKGERNLKDYIYLINIVVYKWFKWHLDKNELFSAGQIGLLQANKVFKETGSQTFEQFSLHCIKRRIIDELRKSRTAGKGYSRSGSPWAGDVEKRGLSSAAASKETSQLLAKRSGDVSVPSFQTRYFNYTHNILSRHLEEKQCLIEQSACHS